MTDAPHAGPSTGTSASSSYAHANIPPPRTITYRHLVSAGTLNPSNPLRVICLADVDCAYAQFEARRLGIPPSVPLVTVQWQGVLAISYSARKYGISRHDTLESAMQRCPHLTSVHVATYAEGEEEARYHDDPKPETHKISLDPYRRESRKIVSIFNELCPLGAVEKASIDELYCDMTLAVRQLILQRFPHLARPPEDSPLGLDTPLPEPPIIHWDGLGQRMPTDEQAKKKLAEQKARKKRIQQEEEARNDQSNSQEAKGTTEAAVEGEPATQAIDPPSDDTGPPLDQGEVDDDDVDSHPPLIEQAATWTDYALACGAELISVVRKAVHDRLGYTMTAGIATNKTLAKLVASENKPDNQTVILPAAVPLYFCDLPFQKIRFLGGKLGDAIASEWTYSTVGDLWSVSLMEMQQKFGDESRWVYDVLRGIDHSAVIERTKNKTMLASKNVKPPIRSQPEAQRWLSILSSELSVRLREAREESPTLWPGTIVLRYLKPRETARSRQSNFPFVKDLKAEHVYKVAQRLWDEAVGANIGANFEVVTIALGFSGLEAGEQGQKSIEGFFAAGTGSNSSAPPSAQPSAVKRAASAEVGVSELTNGNSINTPLASTTDNAAATPLIKTKKVKRNGIESLFGAATASQSQHKTPPSGGETGSPTTSTGTTAAQPTWTCPECHKVVEPLPSTTTLDEPSDIERRLTLAQQDHQDYHFAMQLQREASAALMPRGSLSSQSSKRSASSSGPPASQRSKKGGANKAGIQSFFKKST